MISKNIKPFAEKVYFSMNKSNFGKKTINFALVFRKLNRKYKDRKNTSLFMIKNINKFYSPKMKYSQGYQLKELFDNVEIDISQEGFIYSLDIFKNIIHKNSVIDNITVDYSKILDNSLEYFKNDYYSFKVKNSEYITNQKYLIEGIEILLNKELKALKDSSRKDKNKFITYLENIKSQKVTDNFEEALQRILFFNQILWQSNHALNGLGRLDKLLGDIYQIDKNITKTDALYLIKQFLKTLHKYYWYKSSALIGDTGQIIILGGKNEDGSYFYNDLTSLFIQALVELKLPDPKILLRVSKETPSFLIEQSLKSMNTGIGSPLLSNDDFIIPNLIKFGYDEEDAYNYVVSACWEPAPLGKGREVNNANSIIFLKPLNDLLSNEDLNSITNFESLIEKYKNYLQEYVEKLIVSLNEIEWEEDPILSFFIDNCDEVQLDISKGGAKYNNIGLTTLSLGNTINSLFNIKHLVFDKKEYSLDYLNQIRENNFEENEELLFKLKESEKKFGVDDTEIINLTNEITDFLGIIFEKNINSFGGKFKFGLSAPSYIAEAENIKASLDGRKNFEPFEVHISLDSNKYGYTELIRFASQLKYDNNRINGNVIDFMVNPNFIEENFNKFLDFLILSIKLGFFQMQMNVVSSDTLIKAKSNPEKFPNLIVRVWGFSAYFNDLPLNFKNVLIERALKNEGKA